MMPLLREPTTTSEPAGAAAPSDFAAMSGVAEPTATATSARGRRRGARVRARVISSRPRRARRGDTEPLRLPDPLLTAPMAIEDEHIDGLIGDLPTKPTDKPTDKLVEKPVETVAGTPAPATDQTDTAEWTPESPDRAIDLSDGPKVIFAPAPAVPRPSTPPADPAPVLTTPEPEPAPAEAPTVPSLLTDPPAAPTLTQVPDPIHLVTEPRRPAEPLLATALSVVTTLVVWGTGAPATAWLPLAALPAIGLIALLLPGGDTARVVRATALLAAAATLPVLSALMTPVTLMVALAAAAVYPSLVGRWAGRTITSLAIVSLATPLLIEAVTTGPLGLDFLIDASGNLATAVRLALGSGIVVVALIGHLAMHNRHDLTRTASLALNRERTARAVTAQLGVVSGIDSNTGLPNRDALLRATTVALDGNLRVRRSGQTQIGLVLIEIDRFSDLADSLGPAVADDVAEQVARRLRAEYRPERLLARVGRPQFAVLLTGANADTCATVARRVTELMAEPLLAGAQELSVTCSMGAALSGPGLATADDLLQAADEAARAAQRSGRARWVMFDQAVRAGAHSQATMEIELRDAVRRESIEVAFQPVLALGRGTADDRIVGAEALARWTRADGTVVEPLRFIPMADELGLGPVLGMQVIERALAALVVWRHEGVGVDQVWVNLAPSQLNDPEFAHEVAAQLAIRGLGSSCLVLEISATGLPESEQSLSTLSMLRSLGIAVALDDFGRSGTSLTALRRLPISAIKLDPTLATELGQQDAVPRSIAALGRSLGLRVVVEGVETVMQLQAAREISADAVQGYAIARPMSAEDVTNLLTLRLPRDFRLR